MFTVVLRDLLYVLKMMKSLGRKSVRTTRKPLVGLAGEVRRCGIVSGDFYQIDQEKRPLFHSLILEALEHRYCHVIRLLVWLGNGCTVAEYQRIDARIDLLVMFASRIDLIGREAVPRVSNVCSSHVSHLSRRKTLAVIRQNIWWAWR